jgi:hypothetical protein
MEYSSHPDFRQNLIFHAMHSFKPALRSIVHATQVQQSVNRIQKQLIARGAAVLFRAARRFRNADYDLAVAIIIQRKGQHIRGAGDVHEAEVQIGHGRVVDERD